MMPSQFIDPWTQNHTFLGVNHSAHERRTWSVVTLTAFMMVAEIVGGTLFGSIALIADGWHMATHVAALAICLQRTPRRPRRSVARHRRSACAPALIC
jgi:Co/Zn/Cd efflux system component